MPHPVHIPKDAPELKVMEEARLGGLKYRLLVDADGGPSASLCQGLFYLAAGHSESAHRHEVAETVHVISGRGTARLGDRDLALAPGDTLYIPPGQDHGFTAEEDMTTLFSFPVDRFSEVTYRFAEEP
ncbi:cupin domain-containing protein [Roseivivax sp. CAU 1761]